LRDGDYEELFEEIHEDYQEFLATNRGYRYAVARLVDDY